MSRLSLRERMWGGRVSDPPIKAGAELRQKTVFLGFFRSEGLFISNPGWAPSRRGGNPVAPQPLSRLVN